LRIEGGQLVLLADPLAVGRVGDQDAVIGQRLGFQHIALIDRDDAAEAGLLQVAPGGPHGRSSMS
jgi:hypothetical protein